MIRCLGYYSVWVIIFFLVGKWRLYMSIWRQFQESTEQCKIHPISAEAGVIVFVVSTSFWTLFYIAQEIDQPFGEDANDLPVREMQKAAVRQRRDVRRSAVVKTKTGRDGL